MDWFSSRLGLSYRFLRPAPLYALNPFYWLGALAVIAFVIQGVTGTIMMLYYVPSPSDAYKSTLYIINEVPYGRFLETVHLYTAYAMIMLAFMHMMRGYFVSAHKRPREVMWLIGMLMGFVTLGFGFTGYLLPWTVVSKSATDVGIGMLAALPQPFSSVLTFLISGAGGDATQLLRFYDLHVVVLPAILLVLLTLKMYLLEVHGISEPVTEIKEKKRKLIAIFPDVTVYITQISAIFGAGILLISAVFPLQLPPEFTPQLAASSVAQPDWYFLWIYQILKISVFEGPGLPIALSIVTLVFIILLFLPFIDRGEERKLIKRPRFITIGCVFVAELLALTYWGLISPGQVIPVEQALLVLGFIALIVTISSFLLYRAISKKEPNTENVLKRKISIMDGYIFIFLVLLGSFGIGGVIDSVVRIIVNSTFHGITELFSSLIVLVSSVALTVYVMENHESGVDLSNEE
jgi:quinol-cytochrome oxidoreductase complex cytochrome b subunit